MKSNDDKPAYELVIPLADGCDTIMLIPTVTEDERLDAEAGMILEMKIAEYEARMALRRIGVSS
jgi:hypothetical protein